MIKFKETVKLQKISDDAWIVNDDTKRVGILHKTIQDKYTYLDKTETVLFDNQVEVTSFFKNQFVFEEETVLDVTTPGTFYIKGYPVDYPTPFPVEPEHKDYMDEIPLFAKTESSDVYYAAGWYAINFEKHITELAKIRNEALKKGAWSAAVNAEVARGKAGGLYVDQKLIMTGNVDAMSADEIKEKLRKILDDNKELINITPDEVELDNIELPKQ